jgi:uncharacterized repeat protein (TIGR03803 family)
VAIAVCFSNLYGTTTGNGANDGGTVFKVDSTGHETVLYSFCSASDCTDGELPMAGLVQDAAGNLYGTRRWEAQTKKAPCSRWIAPATRRCYPASALLPTVPMG